MTSHSVALASEIEVVRNSKGYQMTFVSVDASTQSIAFAIWDNELISWGSSVPTQRQEHILKGWCIGKDGGTTKACWRGTTSRHGNRKANLC